MCGGVSWAAADGVFSCRSLCAGCELGALFVLVPCTRNQWLSFVSSQFYADFRADAQEVLSGTPKVCRALRCAGNGNEFGG